MADHTSKFQGFRKYSVEGFEYIVTYFQAKLKGNATPYDVTDQFTRLVASYASKGFEFFRTDSVPYELKPGCLAGIFGAKTTYGYATIVTFRKKIQP